MHTFIHSFHSHTFFFLFHTHLVAHTNNIPRLFIILFFRVKPPRLRSKLSLMWEGVRKACLSMCEPPRCWEPSRESVSQSLYRGRRHRTRWHSGGGCGEGDENKQKGKKKEKEEVVFRPSEHFLTLCKRFGVHGRGPKHGIQSAFFLTCFGCNWEESWVFFLLLNVSIKATQS